MINSYFIYNRQSDLQLKSQPTKPDHKSNFDFVCKLSIDLKKNKKKIYDVDFY